RWGGGRLGSSRGSDRGRPACTKAKYMLAPLRLGAGPRCRLVSAGRQRHDGAGFYTGVRPPLPAVAAVEDAAVGHPSNQLVVAGGQGVGHRVVRQGDCLPSALAPAVEPPAGVSTAVRRSRPRGGG